ncbi:unnamed protein product, partial [Linum tenue]
VEVLSNGSYKSVVHRASLRSGKRGYRLPSCIVLEMDEKNWRLLRSLLVMKDGRGIERPASETFWVHCRRMTSVRKSTRALSISIR